MRSFTLVAFHLPRNGIHESLFRFGFCLLSELVSREVEKLLGLARTKNLCNASWSPLLCLGWRTNGLSRTCPGSKVYKSCGQCGAVVAPDTRRFLFFLIVLHLDTGCTISFLAKLGPSNSHTTNKTISYRNYYKSSSKFVRLKLVKMNPVLLRAGLILIKLTFGSVVKLVKQTVNGFQNNNRV